MSEFKWLNNPTEKKFIFQHNSQIFEVPAKNRRLFPAHIADHGMKRSYGLTDPVYDENGDILDSGNDVFKTCYVEEADVMNPIGTQEPMIVERDKNKVNDLAKLAIDPMNIPRPKFIRKKPLSKAIQIVEDKNDQDLAFTE